MGKPQGGNEPQWWQRSDDKPEPCPICGPDGCAGLHAAKLEDLQRKLRLRLRPAAPDGGGE